MCHDISSNQINQNHEYYQPDAYVSHTTTNSDTHSNECAARNKHTRLNNHRLANDHIFATTTDDSKLSQPWIEKKYRNTGRGGRFARGGGTYRGKSKLAKSTSQYLHQRNKIIIKESVTSQPFRESDPLTCILAESNPQSTAKAFIDKDINYAVSDSGASISVANLETVQLMSLEMHQWNTPINIKFGNGGDRT